jgi:lipopolysaccharide assembly outer membrane protein LptD (OstA)
MKKFIFRYIVPVVTVVSLLPLVASAQTVEAPNRKEVFNEDSSPAKKANNKETSAILAEDAERADEINVEAPSVEILKDSGTLSAKGGVILSGKKIRAQSEEGTYNSKTKVARLKGNVKIAGQGGKVKAKVATINTETQLGDFEGLKIEAEEQGGYWINADTAKLVEEYHYEFGPCQLTTCDCPDKKNMPWKLTAKSGDLTEEGFAHLKSTWLEMFGVPVMYVPAMTVPAKIERASGLLFPSVGYSNRDGFQLAVPFYGVLSNNSDVTITPFVETRSRVGSQLDYRQDFSLLSNVRSHVIFSDDSARGDSVRGLIIPDPTDPSKDITDFKNYHFDTKRLGVSHQQVWQTEQGVAVPSSFVADIHYVSDDLLLREIEDSKLGDISSTYTVSTAAFRTNPTDWAMLELGTEYNQLIDPSRFGEDGRVFQRMPSLSLYSLKSLRPFGQNALGAKTVFNGGASYTDFVRSDGYQGTRLDINPQMSIPFHFKNYLSNSVSFGIRKTIYGVDNVSEEKKFNGGTEVNFDEHDSRLIKNFAAKTSTAVERVYDLDDGSTLQKIASLGRVGKNEKLSRVKHVVEPSVQYVFYQNVSQQDNPFFDSLDRIPARNAAVFQLSNKLYGRFDGRKKGDGEIEQLSSASDELPMLGGNLFVDPTETDFGDLGRFSLTRAKAVKQIASLDFRRAYQVHYEQNGQKWSDFDTDLTMYPTQQFGLQLAHGYNSYESRTTQWSVGVSAFDDRDDTVRLRYLMRDPSNVSDDPLTKDIVEGSASVDQIEGNLELRVSNNVKFGYYGRFDARQLQNQFLEQQAAIRFTNACDCWAFDIGYRQRANPNRDTFLVRFTFSGLGSISQGLYGRSQNSAN